MPAIYRPQSNKIADPDTGNVSQPWATALSRLMDAISGPIQIRSFTVATMPNPAKYPNSLIYVSDASGGHTVACSDGTNWRIVAVLGAIVT